MELLQSCTKPSIWLVMIIDSASKDSHHCGFWRSYSCKDDFDMPRPRQNNQHCAYNIFKLIFLDENYCILIKIPPIVDKSGLVQVMAWCLTDTKPLPEPVLTKMSAITWLRWVNTLRPRQNGRHFPNDIFKWIFLNENVLISIKISLKFVPRGPINNIPTLVQIMAWRRPGAIIWSHYLNQWWLFYWRIYASFSLNELKMYSHPIWCYDVLTCEPKIRHCRNAQVIPFHSVSLEYNYLSMPLVAMPIYGAVCVLGSSGGRWWPCYHDSPIVAALT